MRYRRIPDTDSLFRFCNYPLSFKNQGKRFAYEKMWNLKPRKENGTTLVTSLAWQRYVPTTKYVHASGCRIAFRWNEKLRVDGRFEKDRRIYCGAYRLNAIAVRALASTHALDEISSSDVIHRPENGEIAHTDLRISLKPGIDDVEDTKTAIVDRLWNACSGPLRYIGVCDQDVKQHPSSALITPPAGPCSDTRSQLCRVWSCIRFQICRLVWRTFCQNPTK